jgi:hypothetical protein
VVAASKNQADIRVGNQPARFVQHEGISAFADMYRRDDFPDQLQIYFGNNNPNRARLPATDTVK